MKKVIIATAICLSALSLRAQSNQDPYKEEHHKLIGKTAGEYIFSWGAVDDEASSVDSSKVTASPALRFAPFFNFQYQGHYDFSDGAGFYFGLGIRNLGFINKFGDTVTVKQRQYTLGIPVALKFGSFDKNLYVAIGGEVEMFFCYKQKVFYNEFDKQKYVEWFSDKSDLFNPSLFAEVHLPFGSFVRFKYYLNDFLKQDNDGIQLASGAILPYDSKKSQIMYISIGFTTNLSELKKHKMNKTGKTKEM